MGEEGYYTQRPFLIGQTVSSPNILRTVRRTILRFLTELRRAFSSPNVVRTVRRTTLHFSTGLYNEVQASALTCGGKRSRQHDPKCRLKSSQHTLIIPHRVIQVTTISFWVPETRLRLPQVNKWVSSLRIE